MSGDCAAYLLRLLKQRLERTYHARAQVFFPGEPNRTQEGRIALIAEEGVLQDFIDAFEDRKQGFSAIEEEESEERVRNPSVRRSRPDPAG
jgi:hypothetical protein